MILFVLRFQILLRLPLQLFTIWIQSRLSPPRTKSWGASHNTIQKSARVLLANRKAGFGTVLWKGMRHARAVLTLASLVRKSSRTGLFRGELLVGHYLSYHTWSQVGLLPSRLWFESDTALHTQTAREYSPMRSGADTLVLIHSLVRCSGAGRPMTAASEVSWCLYQRLFFPGFRGSSSFTIDRGNPCLLRLEKLPLFSVS
ncbi:hypothetical protein BCR34DRAFT_335866 [Clohesyomyces aquaticus]|uniref:Secreted protein n=1 Tax=Clohesyomyces aquaticus TaxID=1231657 RepID=A0A1Y1XVL4_9PLEO|nr:hypothetical protein BCR34DRAFT_335866 [Clohesyomyces aquaticus]